MHNPMAKPARRQQGFSLVELLVALVFTSLLFAGMATVFKSSLGVFTTSGERLSNLRRNRMALDMLSDDLNLTGQYLVDMTAYPTWATATNPAFWIKPGADAASADEIYMSFDEALPFDGTYSIGTTAAPLAVSTSNDDLVKAGTSVATGIPSDFKINIRADQAALVKSGYFVVFKDSFEAKQIDTPSVTGGVVSVTIKANMADAAGNSNGSTGQAAKNRHRNGAAVTVVNPAQQVKYSIQKRAFDPEHTGDTVPCLIREQVNYGNAFVTGQPGYSTSVIAENVTNLKAYLKVDATSTTWITGATWGGEGGDTIVAKVDDVLSTRGRTNFKSIKDNPHWFRDIPALVRLDVTTRTARSRTEYGATPGASAFKEQVQTLILLPRHFGLSFF